MDNKYMKVLSHTEATEIKHGPAWLKPTACLALQPCFTHVITWEILSSATF